MTVRIAHLIGHLGYGGTERQLYLSIKHLGPAFKHLVLVCNPSHHEVYDHALRDLGVEVSTLPRASAPSRMITIGRLLRRFRPSVVHSWTVHDNAYAAASGRLAGIPVRWGSLRGTLHSPGIRSIPGPLRHLCFHGVDKVIVNSSALATELLESGLSPERVNVQRNLVECDDTATPVDRAELGLDESHFVVGMVANLRSVKNHDLFLRGIAKALDHSKRIRAVLVGQSVDSEPDYNAELVRTASALGINARIVVAGFRSDVPRLLRSFDVLALTSHSEGMPNVVLEAMAASLPVVATAVGGIPELIVSGRHGFLVAPGSVRSLAEALVRLADSPDLCQEMGSNGRHRIEERHDPEFAAGQLGALYRNSPDTSSGSTAP